MKIEYPPGIYWMEVPDQSTLEPDAWYLGYDCTSCGKRFGIVKDSSYGTVKYSDVATGEGLMRMKCPYCDQQQDHLARELQQERGR